jgi:hypothetical protein
VSMVLGAELFRDLLLYVSVAHTIFERLVRFQVLTVRIMKRRSIFTRLHGATSQKSAIFILVAVRT